MPSSHNSQRYCDGRGAHRGPDTVAGNHIAVERARSYGQPRCQPCLDPTLNVRARGAQWRASARRRCETRCFVRLNRNAGRAIGPRCPPGAGGAGHCLDVGGGARAGTALNWRGFHIKNIFGHDRYSRACKNKETMWLGRGGCCWETCPEGVALPVKKLLLGCEAAP